MRDRIRVYIPDALRLPPLLVITPDSTAEEEEQEEEPSILPASAEAEVPLVRSTSLHETCCVFNSIEHSIDILSDNLRCEPLQGCKTLKLCILEILAQRNLVEQVPALGSRV